jgi:putative transcription antitermination factor YqgF
VIPLAVVECRGVREATRAIVRAAEANQADRVVVGLPVRDDGHATPACRRSEALARELGALGIEVALQPEYLSTDEARRRARAAGLPDRQPVDHLAAQVLLEEYLAG